jgi:hypothetical protein
MNGILCPLAAMAVNVIAQIAAYRLRRGSQFFRSIVEGFLAGAVALAILEFMLAPVSGRLNDNVILGLLVNVPIYLALSYCFYNFVQLGQTSIRIRIYSEIAARPGGINVEQMRREYDDKALTEGRLRRLIESGDIVEREGRYYVGRNRLVGISTVIFGAKRFLLGKGSEFE